MVQSIFEEMGGRYERQGEYILPCLTIPPEKEQPIDLFGRRHLVLMFHLMVASPFPVVATMMSVVLKKQYLGKKKEGNPLLFYSSFLFSF